MFDNGPTIGCRPLVIGHDLAKVRHEYGLDVYKRQEGVRIPAGNHPAYRQQGTLRHLGALRQIRQTGFKLPEVMTVEEIDLLIGSIDRGTKEGQRNRAILETLYSCGLRVSELCNLKLSELYFEEGFIKVEGKGSKQRLVPISPRAIKEIRQIGRAHV